MGLWFKPLIFDRVSRSVCDFGGQEIMKGLAITNITGLSGTELENITVDACAGTQLLKTGKMVGVETQFQR